MPAKGKPMARNELLAEGHFSGPLSVFNWALGDEEKKQQITIRPNKINQVIFALSYLLRRVRWAARKTSLSIPIIPVGDPA